MVQQQQQHSAAIDWATWAFSPSLSAIVVTLLVSIFLPIIIHFYLYRKSASAALPTFLLLGPSGSGKTTILTLLANGTSSQTQTSQETQTAICRLPGSVASSEDQYRSENDTSSRSQPKFQLLDTPGHGKLRRHASELLKTSSSLKGILYVVDSAAVSASQALIEASEYLHDVLLILQKRHTQAKSSKEPQQVSLLVLANKQDVFSALPTSLVKSKLEAEVSKIRLTRSRGVLDSGIATEADDISDEEQNWLGEFGSKQFSFAEMREHGIEVEILGGNALSDNGSAGKVDAWWEWIGQNM